MKRNPTCDRISYDKTHSFRNHNSRRRELWNLQSLESSSTQTAVLSGWSAMPSGNDLPQVAA